MTEGREPEVLPAAPSSDALRQTLLEAFTKGNGAAALSSLLAHAQLSAEQQAVVSVLLSMQGEQEEAATGPPAVVGRRRIDDTEALQQELEDLREVNDTAAAALGACRFCWGGDRQCEECSGRGRAGSRAPDPELFNELVAPAVRRVCQERERASYARRPERSPQRGSREADSGRAAYRTDQPRR